MSKTTDTPAAVNPLNLEESTEQAVEKVPFVQKAKTFVKNHKKSTIAVGALVGLVGVAALTGRKETDSASFDALSPEEQEMTPAEAIERYDIPVPTEN